MFSFFFFSVRLCHGHQLDALDITNRIMRKENYFLAMINRDIIDFSSPCGMSDFFTLMHAFERPGTVMIFQCFLYMTSLINFLPSSVLEDFLEFHLMISKNLGLAEISTALGPFLRILGCGTFFFLSKFCNFQFSLIFMTNL